MVGPMVGPGFDGVGGPGFDGVGGPGQGYTDLSGPGMAGPTLIDPYANDLQPEQVAFAAF